MMCGTCDGTGTILLGWQSVSLHYREPIHDPCPDCDGPAHACTQCDTTGETADGRTCTRCDGAGAYSIEAA